MRKGHLVVFCGIDGSGKTTQAELLINALDRQGVQASYVWARWEQKLVRPFTGKWKDHIKKDTGQSDGGAKENKLKKRKLLNNPVIRFLWLGAFFIDYGWQILVKVRIRLIRKELIVSDRMFYDSVIDQAVNLGNNRKWLLDNLTSPWMRVLFPKPDIVIYIDCPGEIAFARKDDAPDVEYLTDRRKLYKHLAEQYEWIEIDGTQPVDDIAEHIRNVVNQKLQVLRNSLPVKRKY